MAENIVNVFIGEGNLQKILSGEGAPIENPGVQYAVYTDLVTGTLYSWNRLTNAWM